MAEDKIPKSGYHYQQGLIDAFKLPPGSASLHRKRYEEAMEKILADPVGPIQRRHKEFLRKLHKPKNWSAQEYQFAKQLCADIEVCLKATVVYRDRLLEIARAKGISLKKGIVI